MNEFKGMAIHPGLAYAKVRIVKNPMTLGDALSEPIDQLQVLEDALKKSSAQLEEQIRTSERLFSEKISTIFEVHKLIINDPMIVDRAKALIEEHHNAYDSYQEAAEEVIERFDELENEYMRRRVIDIEDARDRVLAAIEATSYDLALEFDRPTIVMTEKMKPSLVMACSDSHVKGFIFQTGFYNQHSGTIIRTLGVPAVVVADAFCNIKDGDLVLLDADEKRLFVNPDTDFADDYLEEKGDDDGI